MAAIKTHQQAITAAASSQLEIDDRETRVSQRIVFQIAYQPTDQLTLSVPRTLRPDA